MPSEITSTAEAPSPSPSPSPSVPEPTREDLVKHLATTNSIRWATRGALTVGVLASLGANILHADPNPVSELIAAWPPLALLLTIELISRIPVHSPGLSVVRLTATTAIAGIAAWVSYWHMVAVIRIHGETGVAPYLIPLTVDGLVVVASVSLLELGDRASDLASQIEATPAVALASASTPRVPRPRPVPRKVVEGEGNPQPEGNPPGEGSGEGKSKTLAPDDEVARARRRRDREAKATPSEFVTPERLEAMRKAFDTTVPPRQTVKELFKIGADRADALIRAHREAVTA